MKALITAKEISWSMPADGGSNIDYNRLCEYIIIAEEKYLFPCIGNDLYKALYADLNGDFNSSLAVSSSFNLQKAYVLNDVVTYESKLYKAIQATTAGTLPTDDAFFEVVTKFNTAKYEVIWNDYLRKILSWATVQCATIPNAYRFGNMGITKPKTDTTESVSASELGVLSSSQGKNIGFLLGRFARFLQDNADYPLYIGNQKPNEAKKHKRKKAGFAFSYEKVADCECPIKNVDGWAML